MLLNIVHELLCIQIPLQVSQQSATALGKRKAPSSSSSRDVSAHKNRKKNSSSEVAYSERTKTVSVETVSYN